MHNEFGRDPLGIEPPKGDFAAYVDRITGSPAVATAFNRDAVSADSPAAPVRRIREKIRSKTLPTTSDIGSPGALATALTIMSRIAWIAGVALLLTAFFGGGGGPFLLFGIGAIILGNQLRKAGSQTIDQTSVADNAQRTTSPPQS